MKLHLTTAENNNLITGFSADFIEINKQRYAHSLIVAPKKILQDWQCVDFSLLTKEHIEQMIEFSAGQALPEVVLLGMGARHQFLHPSIYQKLTSKGIPLECMTSAAACRTYNILMSEGRNVVAALILNG